MGWATIDWPPRNGHPLKPKSKLRKRFIKRMAIVLVGLFFLLAALYYTFLVYGHVEWPYPANMIQKELAEIKNNWPLNHKWTAPTWIREILPGDGGQF
ncbi:hypothetical protein [Desulfofalx alkaliphila]|uniref:hypothetical protein n=1 Tax=Desulfofalx alkaliphila TaxID=105483 RepID=UPI0004E1B642|nr:hypothetical protein [Desulfofalx alkaliphila]